MITFVARTWYSIEHCLEAALVLQLGRLADIHAGHLLGVEMLGGQLMGLLPLPRAVVHLNGVLLEAAGQKELLGHLELAEAGIVLAQLVIVLVQLPALVVHDLQVYLYIYI